MEPGVMKYKQPSEAETLLQYLQEKLALCCLGFSPMRLISHYWLVEL